MDVRCDKEEKKKPETMSTSEWLTKDETPEERTAVDAWLKTGKFSVLAKEGAILLE